VSGPDEGAPPAGAPRPRPRRRRRKSYHAAIKSTHVRSEINVTPLVDVVLVLLIIFMVVTPMLSRGVKVQLPYTRHHDKTQDTGQQLIVAVTADRRVFVETDAVSDETIIPAIKKALEERGRTGRSQEIHVRGDRSLGYGDVRHVLELVHKAGATQVALAVDEPEKSASLADRLDRFYAYLGGEHGRDRGGR
jgi:biopolymer transport protein TolR